jgi:hypothetical protein
LRAHDSEHIGYLTDEPLRAARQAAASRPDGEAGIVARATRVQDDVHQAALTRLPDRPLLARDLAQAAFVDCLWRATPLAERPNPVTPLCALWQTGYVLAAIDPGGVTVELPGL